MMGPDVERILRAITTFQTSAQKCVNSIAPDVALQISTTGPHDEKEEEHLGLEVEIPIPSSPAVSDIVSAYNMIHDDLEKMSALEESLYTSSDTFNNSFGSPWSELKALTKTYDDVMAFVQNNPVLNYVGQRAALMSLITTIIPAAVDAKWAIITYSDYIQRGYDCVYNGKTPSITFDNNEGEATTGNVDQGYDENVNTPKESIDPF